MQCGESLATSDARDPNLAGKGVMTMNRDEELKVAPMRLAKPGEWPPGVRSIAIDEMDAIGVDAAGNLYWHGKPVEIRHPLTLSFWQNALAIGVAVSAILLALIEVVRLGTELAVLSY